jgi:hypothetical protein
MNPVSTEKQAPIGKKLIPGGFRKAYHKVPHDQLWTVRRQLCDLCYWHIYTFKAKVDGKRYFNVFEIEIITKYFAEKGIDAWTGEPLNQ